VVVSRTGSADGAGEVWRNEYMPPKPQIVATAVQSLN
jgi:hypothetical protein